MSNTLIRLKRTDKTFEQLSGATLYYGEPIFIDSSDGCYLIVGDNSTPVTGIGQKKVLQFLDRDIVSKGVFFQELQSGACKFVDQNGDDLELSANANLIFVSDEDPTVQKAVYNGSTDVTISAETIGALSADTSQATTPDVSETDGTRIATVDYVKNMLSLVTSKGYSVQTTLPANSAPLVWNTEYRIGTISDYPEFVIPAIQTSSSAEVRICFNCLYDTSEVTFDTSLVPNATILHLEDFQSFEAGYYYEISIAYIGSYNGTNYISIIADQTALL